MLVAGAALTASAFVLALVRLAAVVCPAPLAVACVMRQRSGVRGVDAALINVVLSLAVVAVAAEVLGLFGVLRFGWLVALLWLLAAAAVTWARARSGRARVFACVEGAVAKPGPVSALGPWSRAGLWCLVGVVVAQWGLQTADSLGGGMFSFDVLWYHMPFAAAFAQSGSVTHILFTQADPFVAYYPATSELFHGLGIILVGNDVLSPLLNLGWMALALLAGWSIGGRWRVEPQTLAIVAMLLALPVFGTTQPGQAFNDIVGLAGLLTAVALLAANDGDLMRLVGAGAALGLAVGTKYTFVVPAVVLVIGAARVFPLGRIRRALLVAGVAILTGGWWYLRAAIHTGDPLGIQSRLGPITLTGARSPLADASQETVISQLSHTHLWLSRFAPGLAHAFGVLWPVVLIAWLVTVVLALIHVHDGLLRTLAAAALLTGAVYLVLPTGASAIAQTSQLFAVNLRYVVPALALGLVLLPPVVQTRASRYSGTVIPAALVIALAAQLEPNVWPTQTARHIAFLVVTLIILGLAVLLLGRNTLIKRKRAWQATLTAGLIAVAVIAGFIMQRHYLGLRYRKGDAASPGLGAIYAWAQTINHARIALYGTVEQYPLYGTSDDNTVTYLGQPAAHGGYGPISSCVVWQQALHAGRYQYLVLTPAPTAPIPLTWTTADPNLKPILHPSQDQWVFQITSTTRRVNCP